MEARRSKKGKWRLKKSVSGLGNLTMPVVVFEMLGQQKGAIPSLSLTSNGFCRFKTKCTLAAHIKHQKVFHL